MSKLKVSKTGNLALKYRPKLLKDLVGQEHIAKSLQGMINSGNIHQSILLTGESGHGKTTTARILARYLNCKKLKKDEDGNLQPCKKCTSCELEINKHPDVTEINAASTRGIDDVKQLMRNAQMMPSYNFRIFILDEIHQFTPQAKEAFLKPLEEPPEHTIWILCTTNPEKLTKTIRGRCRTLEVRSLSEIACAKLLYRVCKKEKVELDKKQLKIIARLTNCQPRESLQALGAVLDNLKTAKNADAKKLTSIVEEVVSLPPYQAATECLVSMYKGNYEKAILAIESTDALIPFSKMLLEYHYKACRYYISDELRSKNWIDQQLYRVLPKKMPIDLMSFIMTKLVRANSMVNEFQVDARFVLSAGLMEAIEGVNRKMKK